jgi:hypothetical protein
VDRGRLERGGRRCARCARGRRGHARRTAGDNGDGGQAGQESAADAEIGHLVCLRGRPRGRSRQWLGAVPAAGVWAACQSLPLASHHAVGGARMTRGERPPGARRTESRRSPSTSPRPRRRGCIRSRPGSASSPGRQSAGAASARSGSSWPGSRPSRRAGTPGPHDEILAKAARKRPAISESGHQARDSGQHGVPPPHEAARSGENPADQHFHTGRPRLETRGRARDSGAPPTRRPAATGDRRRLARPLATPTRTDAARRGRQAMGETPRLGGPGRDAEDVLRCKGPDR